MDLPGGLLALYSESCGGCKSQQKPTALNGTKINYLPVPTDFKGVFGKKRSDSAEVVYLTQKLVNPFRRQTT